MAEVPHLAWPFRMGEGSLAVVEQDTIEDAEQNVLAYLSTGKGERSLSPDFGIDDPTFGPGVNAARLAADIEATLDGVTVNITTTPIDGTGRQDVAVSVELVE